MNTTFNQNEMIRLSREGIEQSVKFFMTVNENILKVQETTRENLNEMTRKNLEMFNKTHDEYQKNIRNIMGRIESGWKTVIEQTQKTDHVA